MDELEVPRQAKFVLSWVNHPKALPLAVPAATVHMAPCAHGGRGAAARRLRAAAANHGRRAFGRRSGGRLAHRTSDRARRCPAPACSMQGWAARSITAMPRRTRGCARLVRLVCSRALVRRRVRAPSSCTACRCRNVAVADEVLDGPRAAVKLEAFNRLWCRWPCCTGCWLERALGSMSMITSRPDPSIAVRALKSAAPYIRCTKQGLHHQGGRAVFSDEVSTRALIEQVAILHQVGIKRTGARRRPAARQLAGHLGDRHPHGHGRG